METVILDIDGFKVQTGKGRSVLEAAQDAGIYIPSLCYHPNLSSLGACRLCLVEIEGMRGLPAACTTLAADKMVVKTRTPQIEQIRRISMEMMLAAHPDDCLVCSQNLNCELQAVAQYLGITEQRLRRRSKDIPPNAGNPLFVIDLNRCILCGRCVRACYEMRGVGVLSFIRRGKETFIGAAFERSLADAGCSFCGACVEVCPTGALMDKDGLLEAGRAREAVLVPCEHECPAGIDIPRYIHLISEKKYSEAVAVIREKVPFPWVLGCVCDHPCEAVCRRNELNEAVFIRGLKRFAAERDTGLWKKSSQKAPPTGKRVAIVGAGPAGLTAAYYLAKSGHSVTVFEALSAPGGMTRVGIPEYRLPRRVLDSEIEEIKRVGIDIKFNTKVESLNDIFGQGYQAIFVAVGAHRGTKMGVEGEDSPGVMEAITLLREVSLGQKVRLGNKVAVIGGGNVAIDAARTALRLGVPDVTIIYRRTRAEMPAMSEEVEGALEEGVKITYLTAPAKIWNENGMVRLECIRMELGEPDSSGRRRPVPIKGSEFVSDYDSVISAIGQMPEVPAGFQVATGRGNLIQVNGGDNTTSVEGVFAGGDAVTGPASVIKAIAAGRKGAIGIDKYLGGSGIIDEELAPVEEVDFWRGRDENLPYQQPRCGMSHMLVEQRLSSFSEIEHGYDEEAAFKESLRCLQCDLRLKISSVKFPPKRGSMKGGGS
ncbi:FAD-dependent oxidoreductase [Dehalococcoidia bacterium]|nr:FAD-dependent oxidoreductase [Dehalococcoidia bacterium]